MFRLRNKHTDPCSSQVNCTNRIMFCSLEVAFLRELPISLLTDKIKFPTDYYVPTLFPRNGCVKMQRHWHHHNSDQPPYPLQPLEAHGFQLNPATTGLTQPSKNIITSKTFSTTELQPTQIVLGANTSGHLHSPYCWKAKKKKVAAYELLILRTANSCQEQSVCPSSI